MGCWISGSFGWFLNLFDITVKFLDEVPCYLTPVFHVHFSRVCIYFFCFGLLSVVIRVVTHFIASSVKGSFEYSSSYFVSKSLVLLVSPGIRFCLQPLEYVFLILCVRCPQSLGSLDPFNFLQVKSSTNTLNAVWMQ